MKPQKHKHRFYLSSQNITENNIFIKLPEYHHIVAVLRYKEGDQILLFDGQGHEYWGRIAEIDRTHKKVKVTVENVSEQKNKERSLILVAGLVKAAKMDFIIQKATEMGVTHIFPVITEHSVVKLDEKRRRHKIDKWQRVMQEAAKQCGRTTLLALDRIWKFEEALSVLDWVESRFICTLLEKNKRLNLSGAPPAVAVLVGPEGGFNRAEVDLALANGWQPLWLGDTALRAETATIASLSILCYQLGFWQS